MTEARRGMIMTPEGPRHIGGLTVLGEHPNASGYSMMNKTDSYVSYKRSLLAELPKSALRVLSLNRDSDFHAVFDGKTYVQQQLAVGRVTPLPIAIIHLYPEDAKLIEQQLGYPVINISENEL